jgi:ribosome-associated protein
MAKRKEDSQKLADLVAKAMDDKKAEDIRILDMRNIPSAVSDFFVICHAKSSTQVQAISDNIDFVVKSIMGYDPFGLEGHQNAEWILVDYADVVAHVFNEEKRDFFKLEKLWGDAKVTKVKTKEKKEKASKSDLDF